MTAPLDAPHVDVDSIPLDRMDVSDPKLFQDDV